jgi:hypothetical protein
MVRRVGRASLCDRPARAISRGEGGREVGCGDGWAGGPAERDAGRAGGAGQVAADGGAAAQDGDLRVPGVAGDQGADARGHLLAVAEDVADEVPGDPVLDADGQVLPAAVAESALGDAPQAGPMIHRGAATRSR